MICSDKGLAIIKEFEGCKLESYLCPAGIWTVGFGHTGRDVTPGLMIDEAEADRLLREDLRDAEKCVERSVNFTLPQDRFDALVSLAFNIGCYAFRTSTLLKLVNAYQFEAAALQFPRWNKSGQTVLAGLTRRRQAEKELFLMESA